MTAKLTLIHDTNLFGEKFNLAVCVSKLGIGFVQLGIQGLHLILQGGGNNDKGFLVKIIQLFFRQN